MTYPTYPTYPTCLANRPIFFNARGPLARRRYLPDRPDLAALRASQLLDTIGTCLL